MISWAISTTRRRSARARRRICSNAWPAVTPSRATQGALGLLDEDPGVQGPLELGGQLAALLALHGVGDGQGGQVGEGDQGQLALGRPGAHLGREHRHHPDGHLVVGDGAGQHGPQAPLDRGRAERRASASRRPGRPRGPAPCRRRRRCRGPRRARSGAPRGARRARRSRPRCAGAGRGRSASGWPRRRRTARGCAGRSGAGRRRGPRRRSAGRRARAAPGGPRRADIGIGRPPPRIELAYPLSRPGVTCFHVQLGVMPSPAQLLPVRLGLRPRSRTWPLYTAHLVPRSYSSWSSRPASLTPWLRTCAQPGVGVRARRRSCPGPPCGTPPAGSWWWARRSSPGARWPGPGAPSRGRRARGWPRRPGRARRRRRPSPAPAVASGCRTWRQTLPRARHPAQLSRPRPPASALRSSERRILPVRVLGRSSTNSILRG